jgi:hypothetical protein
MPYISHRPNFRNTIGSIEERIKVVQKAFCDSPSAPAYSISLDRKKGKQKPKTEKPNLFSDLTDLRKARMLPN